MENKISKLLAPVGLKTCAQEAPLAFDGAPELQWRLTAASPDARQSAYRVRLRDDAGAPVWDSGKVASDRQTQIPYEGPALEPFSRCFWQVMVWDGEDVPTPWSEEAVFETGPRCARDWACGWISCPETDDPLAGTRWMGVETRPGAEVDFTLDFDAPEDVQQAVFDGTAFARWELYCNGVLCRRMNHEWKQDGSSPVRYADLTERVRPGANVLCLRVRADEAGRALAIARFRVRGGGKEHIYESGERWRVAGRPAQPAASDGSAPPMPPRRRGRAPLLRRAFTLDAAARRARLYYCGLGYAACALNGAMVENAALTTEYSRYDRSVYYNAVDVTDLLRVGENCLAVELGRGYYASGKDWIGQQPASGEPKLLLLLKVWLEDGRVVCVGSDGRWKCALGPTLDDSPWYGEKYDARLEWPGWDRPGFDDARWSRAAAVPAPGGELRARVTPPVRAAESLAPLAVTRPAPDVFVYDFGKVTAGWARLRAAEPRGTRIQLTYGERLLENGRVDMERRCAVYQLWEPGQVDIYVCRGGGEEEWTPKFFYKGFRYVEVQGLDHPIALQGLPLHNDLARTGCFHCSNELLDRIHGLVVPTMLNNFNSIPTDTPAYEKRGWTGDAQTICETALLNLDAQGFFRKYVRDLLDCQDDTGAIPDTCPGPLYYPPTPEWMCAMTFIPYWLWMRCGDESALRECWEGMRRYADYELERLEDGLSSDLYYGDWNSPAGSRPPEGSVFSATAFVCRVLDVTAEVARFLGKDASAARYARAARKMRENINQRFFDAETLLYHTDVPCGFRQTPTVLALAFGIAPEEKRRDIARALAAAIRARDGGHLSTGCLGLKYLLPVLSEYGEAETAFAIIDRTDFPSWGYWLANGATTCWETWDTHTRSLDHFYFGCVDDWFYGTLAGIRPLEPGYRRFRVKPVPCGDLRFVQARVDTPYGGIHVNWRREDGRFALDVRVPVNTRAEVCTPGGKRFIAGPGDHHYEEIL